MEHQLSSFLRVAAPPALKLLYGITQRIPASEVAAITMERERMEAKLRSHFKMIDYAQFFSDYAVDLARIGINLPQPGAAVSDSILLTEESAAVMRAFDEYKGKVSAVANKVGKTKAIIIAECNKLIALGLLNEDGLATEDGTLWLELHPESDAPEPERRKKKEKPKVQKEVKHTLTYKPGDAIQFVNLRCPKCGYFVKSSNDMLAIARVKCPVDGEKLLTKEERGEKKGRW